MVIGDNGEGRLAQSPSYARWSSPVQVPGTWRQVSARPGGIVAIKTNGTLWQAGRNNNGSMGNNNNTPSGDSSTGSMTQFGTDTNWIWAAGNQQTTYTLKYNADP